MKVGYISRKGDVFSIEDKGIKFIETLNLLGIGRKENKRELSQ